MVKHLPFPSVCIFQIISLLVFPLAFLPFALNLVFPALWLPLGVFTFLFFTDLTALVLSLTVWWNMPIRISADGIADKNGKIHRWCDAVCFSIKKGPPTIYGRLYYILIINYSDGSDVRFERSLTIIRSIRAHCEDKAFLNKFDIYLNE